MSWYYKSVEDYEKLLYKWRFDGNDVHTKICDEIKELIQSHGIECLPSIRNLITVYYAGTKQSFPVRN